MQDRHLAVRLRPPAACETQERDGESRRTPLACRVHTGHVARRKTNPVSGVRALGGVHAVVMPIGGLPMNPLQIEIIADHHRDRLMREAEMERLASSVRSTNDHDKKSDPRPQRRGLAMLWPRLAPQVG